MTRETGEPVPPDDHLILAERLRQAIGNFVRAVRARANTPTAARFETLRLLDQEGAMSTSELAQRRNVRHQSMRLVVGQLESEGLVERAPDPRDRRSQVVSLTAQGLAALTADRNSRATWIAKALRDHVSAQERRNLEAAVAILERITTLTAP